MFVRNAVRVVFCTIAVLTLNFCASQEVREPDAQKAAAPLTTLFFGSAREAELESCGCSMAPLGGIDHESSVIANWKKSHKEDFLFIEGGSTFVTRKYNPSGLTHFQKKAIFVVDALNDLGVSVLAPSGNDLNLGLANMKELQKRAKFAFVSTNLYEKASGKPVFQPYFRWLSPTGTVTVFSLYSQSTKSKLPSDVVVKDPAAALKEAFATFQGDPGLIVLVSDLKATDREKIAREFPQVRFLLDSNQEGENYDLNLVNSSLLATNPLNRGRELVRVSFDLSHNFPTFYNSGIYAALSSKIFDYESWTSAAERRLALEKKAVQKRKLKRDIAYFQQELREEKSKLSADPDQSIHFEYDNILIKADSLPSDPNMKKLIESYKTALHDDATATRDSATEATEQ